MPSSVSRRRHLLAATRTGLVPFALLFGAAPLLSACGGRDAVDTPVNWWHSLEGGVIAEQRPPPPGVDAPYPKIGTTPAHAPAIASADLRRSVTEELEQQRNLSARLDAETPLPPPSPVLAGTKAGKAATPAEAASGAAATNVPATGATAAGASPGTAAANPAQSSAVLDAVEAPPVPATPAPAPAASHGGTSTADASGAEMAMPAVTAVAPPGAPAPIPAIAQTPPPAPSLPGLALPPAPSYVPPTHPDFALANGKGELLFFARGSDALAPGQDGTLRSLAGRRHSGTIVVHGYGDAGSDAPADQGAAMALAALRARSVAAALQRDGVPSDAIRVTADAFGRGARAELID